MSVLFYESKGQQAVLYNSKIFFFIQNNGCEYFDYDIIYSKTYKDVTGQVLRDNIVEQHRCTLSSKYINKLQIVCDITEYWLQSGYEPFKVAISIRDDDGNKKYTQLIPIKDSNHIPPIM